MSEVSTQPAAATIKPQAMGVYPNSNCRSSTLSMLLNFLLPEVHFFAFAGVGLLGSAGAIAVRAALGHAPMKRGRRMVDMPPVTLAAHVAAVISHGLQVEAGAQAFGRDGVGNGAAVAAVEDAMPGHISRFMPEAAQAFEKAKKIIQSSALGFPCYRIR